MKESTKKKPGSLKRLLKQLFKFYPVLLPITILLIIISAIVEPIARDIPASQFEKASITFEDWSVESIRPVSQL